MKESEENDSNGSHSRLVASIERFTGLMLDRLAQTPTGKLMDEKETRMLGSVVMRSYGIWMKALAKENREEALRETVRRQRKPEPEKVEKEE